MRCRTWLLFLNLCTPRFLLRCFLLISGCFLLQRANAWVYPEHRLIALLAIEKLSPEDRALLENLWSEARMGYESRLTESVIASAQGKYPDKLDYASWFGIAGDHSCSPENMLFNILHTEWILDVANIAAELKIDLERAQTPTAYINAIRESDSRLQRVDYEYATRASSNNAHFLLARPYTKTPVDKYLAACNAAGTELNAFGVYSMFHSSALIKATRYARSSLTTEQKSTLMLSALADEAFAQHFLEDGFAAGHVAGTRGSTAVRKGTHDYYNEKGLEVATWGGERVVLMGDAYMHAEDAELVANTVKLSIRQFLEAAGGQILTGNAEGSPVTGDLADSFNICKNNFTPKSTLENKLLIEVLLQMPMPGLASGKGELPRFRSEVGPFIGVSTSLNGDIVFSGFGKLQTKNGLVPGLEADFRYGFGLDGVLNQSGDGLVFVQVGWKLDGSSSSQYSDEIVNIPANTFTNAIPGRSAFNLRVRLPFYIVPGDLILAAPILLLTSPDKLTKMAAVAANGGLVPWQSAFATPIGRFQFVLGREVGVSFYGLTNPKTILIIPLANDSADAVVYKSIQWNFPVLEYRPDRTFSMDQSSSLMMQLSFGFDVPYDVESADNNKNVLRTVWHAGVRFLFNWRHYYD